jgi:hypothetical protein
VHSRFVLSSNLTCVAMTLATHLCLPFIDMFISLTFHFTRYIALQRCYEAKAAEDCEAIHARVVQLLTACGRQADATAHTGPADLELCRCFCKNAWDLRVGVCVCVKRSLVCTIILNLVPFALLISLHCCGPLVVCSSPPSLPFYWPHQHTCKHRPYYTM